MCVGVSETWLYLIYNNTALYLGTLLGMLQYTYKVIPPCGPNGPGIKKKLYCAYDGSIWSTDRLRTVWSVASTSHFIKRCSEKSIFRLFNFA